MSININAIRQRATQFVKKVANFHYEMGDAQRFIIELCAVFEINHWRVHFEVRVTKLKEKRGRIDALLPGLLLIEMKSAGADLEQAYHQALSYFPGLKNEDLPRYVLVSDFQHLHLYDQETHGAPLKITLEEFPQHLEYFLFLAGYEKLIIEKQEKINKQAAEKLAALHDAMKATGYCGKDLETYLVRLLFCLFAEDTGLLGENDSFLNYLVNHSKTNGSDLHSVLFDLFNTLNNPEDRRPKNLPEQLKKFPYINGALFDGNLAQCYFNEAARRLLIECADLDWSEISPAIFGSLFQAIMHFDDEAANAKTKKRREFGAHYTSEENILKIINPLFMDELCAEFKKCPKNRLAEFHQKLATLNFFDPACGCGNFLIIAYRELRLLELEVIKAIFGNKSVGQLDIDTLILCNVDQFHGIDIDESAVHIAMLALWLVDHQMNLKAQELGVYYHRIPLTKKANIVHGNALRLNWEDVIAPDKCSFILGNPPFVGYSYQTKSQKEDLALVFHGMDGAGVLDLVAAWYVKAASYIQNNPQIPVAFVATNSITQGEQVGILWKALLKLHIKIFFAHRTFRWNNEGRGVAAVHCVIIGFSLTTPKTCYLFNYPDINDQPVVTEAKQINPYLVDAPTILIEKRKNSLSKNVPEMNRGNMPNDNGNLLLSTEEVEIIKQNDPIAAKYIRPFVGSDEFINNLARYCLWLQDSTPFDRINSPELRNRIEKVKQLRLASNREATKKLAETPYLFGEIRQKDGLYLAVPKVSSERRKYIPIGYLSKEIASDSIFMIPNASLYDFGIITSIMHNAWMRAVCGRLKSDYNYSNTIVYNNFPFPEQVKAAAKGKIEKAAQKILEVRKQQFEKSERAGQKCSLALLYNPESMPIELFKAHQELDKAVDAAYGYKGNKDDASRVAFLFERYQQLIAALVKDNDKLT